MRLIKLAIVIWMGASFFGLLVAFPGGFFLLGCLLVLGILALATVGSPDYWRQYYDHVYRNHDTNDDNV